MKITECPRDAIQGIKHFIPTEAKAKYLNELLSAGFDTLDFGSFVSPKAMPQMADTAELVGLLDLRGTSTKLLAIIGNEQGARQACAFPEISYLGFPFSVSEFFQMRNIGATMLETFERVKRIQELCLNQNKELLIYLSMAFGNPYGEEWNTAIVLKWVALLNSIGISRFSLADTTGLAYPEQIFDLFGTLITDYPQLEFGAHFHTTTDTWREKVDAAYQAGCRSFDTAISGYGGCPMAGGELVGNMPTDKMLAFMAEKGIPSKIREGVISHLELAFQQLITY